MKKSVVAAGIVGLLMPMSVVLAEDTRPAPPPRPGTARPVPPPRPADPRERVASTTRATTTPPRHSATSTPEWLEEHREASSTASTTPRRYRPTDLRGFLRWMFTLPTTTTVGELRARIDFSSLTSSSNAASAQLAVPSDNIFASMLEFFGFPISGGTR